MRSVRELAPLAGNRRVIVTLLLAIVVLACSSRFLSMTSDDAYITYRYAKNFSQGRGFVFNPGEYVLATTSPLHAAVLSILAFVHPDLPLIGNIVSIVALFAMGLHAYLILAFFGYPVAGLTSALLIVLNIWSYSLLPLETVILLSLEIGMFYYYFRGRFLVAAVLGALAFLTRFDAIIAISVLFLHNWVFIRDVRRFVRPAIVFLAVVVTWFSFSLFYFGTLVPNTFSAKTGFENSLFAFVRAMWPKALSISIGNNPFLSVIPVVLSIVSLWSAAKKRLWDFLLIPLWGVLYIVGYSLIGIAFPHGWYFYPLVIITLMLGCHGGNVLYECLAKAETPDRRSLPSLAALALVAACCCSRGRPGGHGTTCQ